MKRHLMAAVAALAISGVVLPADAQQAPKTTPQESAKPADDKQQARQQTDRSDAAAANGKSGATTQPTALFLVVPIPVPVAVVPGAPSVALAPDGEEIRDVIASATEAAFTEDGFNDLVERLVDADRNRLGAADLDENAALEAAVKRAQAAWKSKFNNDLDIENESIVFGGYPVIQGVISSEAQTAGFSERYVPNEEEDYNLEPGREVAVVNVPKHLTGAQQDAQLPELIVPMIDEAYGWKIDIPNRLTAQKLQANMIRHLNEFADAIPQLTADKAQGVRLASHHVLMALMDIPPHAGGTEVKREQQQQGKQQQDKQQQ